MRAGTDDLRLASQLLFPLRQPRSMRRSQSRRLRALLAHAWARVPYYRKLMQAHDLHPSDFRSPEDLGRFPISRKTDLKQTSTVLTTGLRPDQLVRHATSGSTGQPLKIFRSWREERLLGAYRWRVLWEYGYRPWHRHADIEELQPQANGDDRRLHRLCQRIGLFRQVRVQALQEPHGILAELAAFDPQALTGYAGVVYRVACEALERGDRRVRPRFVACHSDQLTPGMRGRIELAFAAPVYELYDAYETNLVAWECPEQSGLHTAEPCALVEVLDQDGRAVPEGDSGEVVLTNLVSRSMPLIRFAIGDLARRGATCPCGRPSRRLEAVEGRTVEYFPLPDGRVVHPYEVYARIEDTSWIRRYQLVQAELGRFVLRVVPERDLAADVLSSIHARILAFLGAGVDFKLELLAQLQPGPVGKDQAFRSLVGRGPAGSFRRRGSRPARPSALPRPPL